MSAENIFLLLFLVLVGVILAVDLSIGNKNGKTVSLKTAAVMSLIMILLSCGFYIVLITYGHLLHGVHTTERLQEVITRFRQPVRIIPGDLDASLAFYRQNLGIEFLTGYVIEYALSVDNIFVILLIFRVFRVPQTQYHRVLFWGILGALVLRFAFIFLGATLLERFEWILYVFGVFLIFSGLKSLFTKAEEDDEIDSKHHPVVVFLGKFFKITPNFHGERFTIRQNGVLYLTPLFIVLCVIEASDLIFAVDSIPAIFSVTKDPYIVFFSNIFAIMGLRSMFFLLAGIVDKFKYLKTGVSLLLIYIGLKMLLEHYLEQIGFTNIHSLLVIIVILSGSILASLVADRRTNRIR